MYLDALASWVERNRDALEAAGVSVKLSEPTRWDEPSQGVVFSMPDREAELWVWTSGECEVAIGDVAAGNPEQTHHDLTSDEQLVRLLNSLRARLMTPAA